ncbi:MAG: NAD(P)/FAD-dependent oxidoreductase [Acidobacteriales bacterium]|nr:NAD(P)/FAD-dependent oxidoreductase [Terriglobales bacterium]
MGTRHRVVIVGGGFGGLCAAQALRNEPVDVILIDRHNYHLFQPLLYQVATGGLSGGDIASPLRWILRRQTNTSVLLAEVSDLDVGRRKVILDGVETAYDTLVLAAGASHGYFGHETWRDRAPGLKTLDDASEIRNRIFRAFEAAEQEPDKDERRAWLSFVIVGAGPTGVELAGALAEVARDTLKGNFRNIEPGFASIQIVDRAPAVLPGFPPELSAKAETALLQLGVRPRLGVMVKDIDDHGVLISSARGEAKIDAHTVLWAAGVEASPLGYLLKLRAGVQLDKSGKVLVQPDCSIASHPEIFVIGDLAAWRDPNGHQLPGLAPVAMQQGAYVGHLIGKRLRGETSSPFHYVDKGNLATIGRNRAVGSFRGIRFSGFWAWLTWLFVHLLYLVGFQNRLLVSIQWAFHYFTYNRRARLISPSKPVPPAADGGHAETKAAVGQVADK